MIHLALASDNNYFEGLLTTTWSVARNCSRANELAFHVLDGGISEQHWTFLTDRLSPFGCRVNRIAINDAQTFATFQTYHGNSRMTYARLLLPDLLPDVHQIIYSDVDILWAVDIAELWDSLNPNAILHCTPSKHSPQAEIEWCARFGFDFEHSTRFCAGMVVFNLDKFRAEGLHRKMLAALDACGGKAPCNDETVLNALVFGRKDRGFLSSRWQHMSGGQKQPLEATGCVIHYLMDTPWQSIHKYHHLMTDAHMLWHRFHAEARQISVWRSMRMANSIADVIFSRALAWSAHRIALVRHFLRGILILTGKKDALPSLNDYMMPFDISHINRHLLPN